MRQAHTAHLGIRLPFGVLRKFKVKGAQYGTPSALVREFIEAFCEDRLHIDPPEPKGSLYAPRS